MSEHPDAVLAGRRLAQSPRYAPPPTPLRARLIHGGVALLWLLLFLRAFGGGGVFAWSAGLAYVGYDTVLLVFVFIQTLHLLRPARAATTAAPPAPVTVLVAAHDEAAVLPITFAALLAQRDPADAIILADDGSTDATADWMRHAYGLARPEPGRISPPSPVLPALRWLALPQGGKARALNAACLAAETELVLSVDADTLLDPGALGAMRAAFAADPALVAATGVLSPVCGPTLGGRVLQWFQTYEYVRNFLSRYAWMRQDGLLLISGAFACYRRAPLIEVGGFDPDCLVEDYELIHRLRDAGVRRGVVWRTGVVGSAHARTDAPATIGAFLRQRRRWFGGFLQTQFWYRHMVGNPAYGRLGTAMLPVKAVDTLQPMYGLLAAGLLAWYAVRGELGVVNPVAGVIGAKIVLDLAFHLWSLVLYRRWLGAGARVSLAPAILAAVIEPFTFQILRHLGAALGWVSFLRRSERWGTAERRGVLAER